MAVMLGPLWKKLFAGIHAHFSVLIPKTRMVVATRTRGEVGLNAFRRHIPTIAIKQTSAIPSSPAWGSFVIAPDHRPNAARQFGATSRVHRRCAVQVPEHVAARHVPEPDVPLSRPKPTARLIPELRVTLIVPASATRPDAETLPVFEAT